MGLSGRRGSDNTKFCCPDVRDSMSEKSERSSGVSFVASPSSLLSWGASPPPPPSPVLNNTLLEQQSSIILSALLLDSLLSLGKLVLLCQESLLLIRKAVDLDASLSQLLVGCRFCSTWFIITISRRLCPAVKVFSHLCLHLLSIQTVRTKDPSKMKTSMQL